MEHCQDCGKEFSVVYDVPDKVWKKITPKKGEGGILCIKCADKRAKKLGINLFWTAKAELKKSINLKEALELRKHLE